MKRRTVAGVIGILLLAAGGLTACSSNDASGQVVHIEIGTAETETAQTAEALAQPTPTPGPSPTPSLVPTPYVIPTDPPELDGSVVITRVGREEITLEEFRARVRFERWRLLYRIAYLVEKHGAAKVLDLTSADNALVSSTFATLADSNAFGEQVHRLMVIDAISVEEALRRNLEVDPHQFDAKLAEYLDLTVGEGGQLPPEFDETYSRYIEQMQIYSGLTEEDFRRIVRARTLYSQEQFLISYEPEAVPSNDTSARIGIEVQDIVLKDHTQAEEAAQRLAQGETMHDIAMSFGLTPTSDETWRLFRWSDPNLPDEVIQAVGTAQQGDIIGPLAIPQGWYVALIGQEVFDILSPQDIDTLRKEYFLDWVESKMDDPEYMEDFQNWADYIPQEPLPRDVSPLLVEENIVFPDDTTGGDLFGTENTPTP